MVSCLACTRFSTFAPNQSLLSSEAKMASIDLNANVTDDGLPSGVTTVLWTKTSGPGPVTFENAAQPSTKAIFTEAGTYVLRLTANDGEFSSFDEVTINVE